MFTLGDSFGKLRYWSDLPNLPQTCFASLTCVHSLAVVKSRNSNDCNDGVHFLLFQSCDSMLANNCVGQKNNILNICKIRMFHA